MQEVNTIHENKLDKLRASLSKTSIAFNKNLLVELGEFLENVDLPTTKQESWKYTRLTKLSNTTFSGFNEKSTLLAVHERAYKIVFENGKLRSKDIFEGLNTLTELSSTQLSEIHASHEVFDALNLCYAEDGVFIEISKTLDRPIEILHLSNGNKINNLRHFIRLKSNTEANITMIFSSEKESKNFSNCVTEFHVEQGAHLSVTKIQIESGQDIHLSKEKVFQHRDSNFTLNTVTLDGLFVRNEVEVAVEGVNAETNLNGVYVANQQQFVDNHTTIDHKVAHCLSNELYKGVLFDKATGVFNGKVFVRKDAQKINAFQSNANILMSQDASVNAKPELEIYADDVKCSHGSTTGQLDEEAVFYLRSRGLSDKAARNLLVSAFVGQVLEKIENTEILDFVYGKLNERFGWEY